MIGFKLRRAALTDQSLQGKVMQVRRAHTFDSYV
jgi:hypothetical protein